MTRFRPSFLRELMQLSKTAEEEFHGQVKIFPSEGLDVNTFTVEIVPELGLYAHASLLFLISITDQYPNTAPLVTCLTPVFHPNIEMGMARDNVCLNIFQYWERHFGIKDLLHALLFLLYEPNFDDPYNLYCTDLPSTMSIEQCIRHTLAGGVINSVRFPPNEAWCQWASENGLLPSTGFSVPSSLLQIPTKSGSNEEAIQVEPTVEHQQSVTNRYFRRSLSGQFTPAAVDMQDSSDWTPARSNEHVLPFGFICKITIETLSNAQIDRSAPWSNYSRYYFAETCNLDHVEFLWDSVAASVGFDQAERAGEQLCSLGPQRSTVSPWTMVVDADVAGLVNSELSDVQELEQMLAALLVDRQEDGDDDAQNNEHNLETENWNRAESSRYESGPDSLTHDNAKLVPDEKFNVGEQELSSFSREGTTSGAEPLSNGYIPSVQNGDQGPLCSNDSQDIWSDRTTMQMNQSSPIVDQQPSIHGPNEPTPSAIDSETVENVPPDRNSPQSSPPEVKDRTDDTRSTRDRDDLEERNSVTSNDEVSDQHAHQSLQIALSSEEFDLLPVDIQALLEEPTLDLSFLYPVVDWYGSSDWHIHPRQFEFLRRLLLTLRPASWFCYQTRWPPYLAPGRGTTVTPANCTLRMEDDCRASSSQLRYDLFWYCRRTGQANSVLLVDPLAVSPWSPIVNYVIFTFPLPKNSNVVSVRSVQWMSVSQSLCSSFYFESGPSPPRRPWSFLLTSTCLLCNFLYYLSRMELYGSSLGYSRRTQYTVIDYLAGVCLTPATLGCGQCAVLDAWPLWAASRAVRFLCSLVWRLGSHGYTSRTRSSSRPALWFPFNDLDEI